MGTMMLTILTGVALLSGSVLAQHNQKGSYVQSQNDDFQAEESVTASEVEYVNGPLAPLYDFLIQKRLQQFCKLLRDAKLEQIIQDLGGSWTLFAPTDASFIFLPGGTLEELQRNPETLRDFILYHFVASDLPSSQIQNELLVNSVQGSPLRFNIYDQVLTVSGAQIVEPDLQFELGRIHIIDHPLYPIPTTDIVSYLQQNYREIYRLLLDTGLTDYISSGTFTFLVPDDEAFNFLTIELKEALASNASLAERILFNHILHGSVFVGGITDGMTWETIGGHVITFTIRRGLTFANGIPIILSDVPLTNGVIHVLNRVILPEGIEADCQCKPSTESSQNQPKDVHGRFAQTQRPPFSQTTTTRKPVGSFQRQTQKPFVRPPARTVDRTISSQTSPPFTPQRQNQLAPGRTPFVPSRTRQPPSAFNQITQPPYQDPANQVQPEDDVNAVFGPGEQTLAPQKRPTTRFVPRPTQPPHHSRFSTPAIVSNNEPGAHDIDTNQPGIDHPPRQVNRWSNRQPTPPPRYPTPGRSPYRTQATTRSQHTTRSWGNAIVTQPSFAPQPGSDVNIDTLHTTESPNQFRTDAPRDRTTNWQQRKQVTVAPRSPAQQVTTQRPARVPPPQRRPLQPRPTVRPTSSSTNAPFESNRQRPSCRLQTDRVTHINQHLPLCSDEPTEECQPSPFNPADPRPLCPIEMSTTDCRSHERFSPSDNRPLCPNLVGQNAQNCRVLGNPTYVGDRRPICPPSTTVQQGCRDASEPFNPLDNRPLCSTSGTEDVFQPPNVDNVPTQQCRRSNDPTYPQDTRPLCPEEPQQDCRPFLERPKPGDRRPVCQVNRQQPPQRQKPVNPTKDTTKPTKVNQSPRQNTYPPRGRYPTSQTTQRQSWQTTTQTPQSQFSTEITTNKPPLGKQPQRGTSTRPTAFQPSNRPFQSRPQPGLRQPQPPPRLNPTTPQTGTFQNQPQSGFQPQTGAHTPQHSPGSQPILPQSDPYPAAPQSGVNPSEQQQPPSSNQPQSQYPPRPTSSPGQWTRPRVTLNPRRPEPPISQPQSGLVRPPVSPLAPPSGTYPSSEECVRCPNQQGGPVGSPGFQLRGQNTPSNRSPVQGQATPTRGSTAPQVPISVTGTSTTPGEDSRRTLYEIVEDPALLIRNHPVKLSKIFSLFHKAGIEDLLTGPGPTTVFLPSDDAFASLPRGVIDQLEENPEQLRKVLLYHVVNADVLPSSGGESYTLPSLEGTQLLITMLNGGRLILISGAKAIAVTRASNGIFYVINQLLYPLPHENIIGAVQSRPDLTTLAWLLPQSGLQDLLQGQTPYTILAPTDTAFAQLSPTAYEEITRNTTALQEILLNHVIEGAHYGREFLTGATFPSARGGKLKFQVVSYGYQVNDINIKTPEIVTGTGVIHLIDQVILEPRDLQFFINIENAVAGQDSPTDSIIQQPPTANPRTGNRPASVQPQVGGLQPPGAQVSVGGRRPTTGGSTTSGQRPVPGQNPTHGQRQQSGQSQPQASPPGHGQRQSFTQPGQQQNVNQRGPGVGQQQPFSGGRRQQQPSRGQLNGPSQTQAGGQPNDVAELARSMGLNHFANWISNTGLLEKVHDGGVYTVFAPTDDAVNALPQEMSYSIDSNPNQMKSVLQYHIIPQRINLNSLSNEETASTLLQGKKIRFNVYGNGQPNCRQMVTASGTPIDGSLATMGSVQLIPVTQVLYQPAGNVLTIIDSSPILTNLSSAVKNARLSWVLSGNGPVTLFAPSDTAFQNLSEEDRRRFVEDKQAFSDLLKKHMVRGTFFSSGIQDDLEKKSDNGQPIVISLNQGIMTVNSIPVAYSDITATNGVLHVIDQFL
ncbi:uncharacterized protein LOC129220309 [Uloborus diversus]|uniref:uncharacterized protein LOC129220309 n=1 Tax=Uloborus diversus TaxID=327109 RepID=UPI002409C667|nr:uncharacterized protein LOC129220309 [Uloborus diversus]